MTRNDDWLRGLTNDKSKWMELNKNDPEIHAWLEDCTVIFE